MERHLLGGGACSNLSVNGAALIRGRRLFEARRLSKEMRLVYI